MGRFKDGAAAKDFLIARITEEARLQSVPLSAIELRMLWFSEVAGVPADWMELNEQFDREYDASVYEKKITGLIEAGYKRAKGKSAAEVNDWKDAVRARQKEDHYLGVMVDNADLNDYRVLKSLMGPIIVVILILISILVFPLIVRH